MSIHKFPDIHRIRRPDELELLKRIALELREADRELCEDLDKWELEELARGLGSGKGVAYKDYQEWEREIAAIVPRDYKEE